MITFSGPDQTRLEIWDVTKHDYGGDIDFALLDEIRRAPAWLTSAERLLLFTLIYCLRPRRYLEVGILFGGASLIVAKAMDAVQHNGRLILVDSKPQVEDSNWRQIEHRSVLVQGWSPAVLKQAAKEAGGPFDFVFIDAGHQTNAVMRDAHGVFRYLSDGAYILFHDSFRLGVKRAIDRFVNIHSLSVVDFGLLTREFTRSEGTEADGSAQMSCGFRLVQYRRRHGRRKPINAFRGIWSRFVFLFRESYRRAMRFAARQLSKRN